MSIISKIGYTPRQAAYAITIQGIANATVCPNEHLTGGDDLTPNELKQVTIQLTKLHNQLLNKSGLDGVEITC